MKHIKQFIKQESNNPDKDTLIENFSDDRLGKYEKAIKLYGEIEPNHGLFISPVTYDVHGRRFYSSYSLHINKKPKDLTEFWDIYRSL